MYWHHKQHAPRRKSVVGLQCTCKKPSPIHVTRWQTCPNDCSSRSTLSTKTKPTKTEVRYHDYSHIALVRGNPMVVRNGVIIYSTRYAYSREPPSRGHDCMAFESLDKFSRRQGRRPEARLLNTRNKIRFPHVPASQTPNSDDAHGWVSELMLMCISRMVSILQRTSDL